MTLSPSQLGFEPRVGYILDIYDKLYVKKKYGIYTENLKMALKHANLTSRFSFGLSIFTIKRKSLWIRKIIGDFIW